MHHGGVGRLLAAYDRTVDPLAVPLARYLASGDESAIDEVVAATRDRLVSAARRIVSHHDAEDAVQTAYLSLVRHRGGALEAPVLPWLLTATIRTAYRRKALLRRDAAIAERLARAAAAPAEGDADDLARLRREVARLPARYRDPVVLHDLAGLSTFEVARLLDLPEPTVRTRLHRARKLVRARWSPVLAVGLWTVPWFFADRTRDVGAAHILVGGLVNTNAVAGVVVLALAAGAGAGWLLGKPSVDGERRAEQAESRVKDLEAKVASLESATTTAGGKGANLGAAAPPQVATVPAPAPTPPAMTEAAPPAVAGGSDAAAAKGARFAVPGREDALKAIDWDAIGASASAMVPLLTELSKQLEAGKALHSLSPDLLVRINERNAPLVTGAVKYASATGRGLEDVNTGFSEPAFMVNAIAATLAAAKLPLTDVQAKSLEALAIRATEEDKTRVAGYGERTYALERVIGDSESRDRFFQAAFPILSAEQHAALSPPGFERRVQTDIFSAGIMWATHAQVLPFDDKESLVVAADAGLRQLVALPDAEKDYVRTVVAEWVNGLSRDVLEVPADALSQKGMVPLDRVHEAARRQLGALQRLGESGRFDEATVQKLREVRLAIVPVKRAAH